MALSPPPTDNSSFGDPFQLDRLADELADRELFATKKGLIRGSIEEHVPDLPEYTPLSHNDPHLTAETFDVEDFLLERKQIPLPDLRTELRQYLAQLKEELVKLINDDYEAFISLSTDLKDEGERLERLKSPMSSLKATVIESKKELHTIQQAIHEKLSSRSKLREEQALLHLLLKISESVIRLESLLLIASPEQDLEGATDMGGPNFLKYPSHSEEGSEDKLRGNKAKHLGRVAAEYTQLLYHARKARTEKCVFVDEIQWRIDRIHSTLSSDLDQLFSQTLVALADPKGENRGTELEKSKLVTDLTECLRTYDALGLWKDAEDVIRQEVVRVFLKKTVYQGAMAAPRSPIVPNTPFRLAPPTPMTSIGTAQPIPYTPFTAFVPKQNSYRIADAASDLPRAHLLEETDDALAALYNQLLRFVERDLCRIMDAAEKVTVKPSKEADLPQSVVGDEKAGRGFQIMSNVVWDELGRSIMDEIGGVVFSSGRPKEFRKHYETTQSFLRSLELLAPSRQAVEDMRQHPVYAAFERRWQLPVYFQLRWKEIIGTLEDTLSLTRLDPIVPKDGAFATPQAAAVWIAVSACWSSEIYIPELGHRFWKLTLQIINRYRSWLDENIADKIAVSQAAMSPIINRAGTPIPEAPVAESQAVDDFLLRQFAAVIVDIRSMETNTSTLWRQIISMMMPEMPDEDMATEDALRESVQGLTVLISSLSSKIIFVLTKRCYENLLQVRGIPTQLRMSNKRASSEVSSFVPTILRPVKQFFGTEGPGVLLKSAYLKPFSTEIFNNVTQRYVLHRLPSSSF
ncbi:oligomeric golgi complex component, COG2-domain-containing protein [Crepidotus variabilis]|uniref:Conserved oligomeric Golgi complex subunit 2 n=1 Tax=Crepidotus variabilis TaxID=179855 RepID=A0A9P6EGU8_9AGAR|nr:oligomeric golgi complex component, COG2-domain-containing protein [Crepidotus variabilis]